MANISSHRAMRLLFSLASLLLLLQFPGPKAGERKSFANEAGGLQDLLGMQAGGFPYGDPQLETDFPAHFDSGRDSNNVYSSVSNAIATSSGVDFSSERRKSFSAANLPVRRIFPVRYLRKFALRPVDEQAELQVLKLRQSDAGAVYSAMVRQEIPCSNCEYPVNQEVNMLFVVEKGAVSDRLMIGYQSGDGFQWRRRYCYIDRQGEILVKDFEADELTTGFVKEQKWRIDSKGRFKRVPDRRQAR